MTCSGEQARRPFGGYLATAVSHTIQSGKIPASFPASHMDSRRSRNNPEKSPSCRNDAPSALALLLYTSWRREDAPRTGPQHIYEERQPDGSLRKRIKYRLAKNEDRGPVDMDIPLHPNLECIIDATPSGHLSFLITAYGKPYATGRFGNRFKDWCRQAGLPHCSCHGLRSAVATRLANSGASQFEIMAITGHKSLKEVERYTKAANRKKLADVCDG